MGTLRAGCLGPERQTLLVMQCSPPPPPEPGSTKGRPGRSERACPVGGKGLTSDLPAPLIRPRPGSPSCSPGREACYLPATGPPPGQPASRPPGPATTGFHLLTGGQFTADHPRPGTRLPSERLIRVRCKSPHRPQSKPRQREHSGFCVWLAGCREAAGKL